MSISFLEGQVLDEAIREIMNEPKVRCAVAFWGKGATTQFANIENQEPRILCNLSFGGTNPMVIKELKEKGAEIKQCDILHAKVYIGQKRAVVTSANVSANGLGLEGSEQRRWIEAGIVMDDVGPVADWFEKIWAEGRLISDSDIEASYKKWRSRRDRKPTLLSFADFDVEAESLPLVSYGEYIPWKPHKDNIKKAIGHYDENIYDRVNQGLEIYREDAHLFQNNRQWILVWRRANSGMMDGRTNLWWMYTGRFIEGGWFSEDEPEIPRDVLLQAEDVGPEPFNATEDKFKKAFKDLVDSDKFRELREEDDKRPWFTEQRLKMNRQFWRELKECYHNY